MNVDILISAVVGFLVGAFVFSYGKRSIFTEEEADAFGAEGREAINQRIEKRKARIMDRAHELGQITNDDVEDLFCISNSTATNYLGSLVRDGKLERVGRGRGVHYKPVIA